MTTGLEFDGSVTVGTFLLRARMGVDSGSVVALLGPNGAGKSTLLRSVAGLVALDTGRIVVGDRVVDEPEASVFVPPERRGVGVVFQDHRLFPHLRVVDNVAFGLRSQGVGRAAAQQAARDWLGRLGLAELARRRPAALSGGQAQRVALARALASRPSLLVLDEPLAALDVQTRASVQGELRDHLREFQGPTLLVTHDPVEALLLADRIVVLEEGRVVQEGSAAEITSRPATPYVAKLVGLNAYLGVARSGEVLLHTGSRVYVADAQDGEVLATIRPAALTVHVEEPHGTSARNVWRGTISAIAPLGDRIRLTAVTVDGPPEIYADVTPTAVAELGLAPGREIWLSAKATELSAYPAHAG